MIIITIEIDVPPDKAKELLQTLMAISERIRMETGCIGCEFLKDVGDETRYRIIGKWKRKYDLNHHLRSEAFSVLRGAMSLLQRQPKIRLDVVSCTKGMESLHKVRDEKKRINMTR